jgi:thiol-disulfide isomerase/thioredoxin
VTAASPTWTKLDQSLTSRDAPHVSGKIWTIGNLKGKTTWINVWATWCEPCRTELPQLQKLYDLVGERKDIQVITVSVDENPGLVEPFLRENHYTFPAILAKSLGGRAG